VSIKIKKEIWPYIFLVIFVFTSRLPFISGGYGLDGDSWAMAKIAKHIHDTGEYEASRFPGFPVHEYLCSLFIKYGYNGLNIISAFFSAIAVLFFALSLKLLRFRRIFLASITLAMVPIFYIHSCTTIDYLIAIAFVLGGLYFLLKSQNIVAGILLGFAIGTRITSGAMLIPLSILLVEFDGFKNNFKRISKFILPALITGSILFLPVVNKYGFAFFTYYNVPYPQLQKFSTSFLLKCGNTWSFGNNHVDNTFFPL
jgi:hypothetical protein